MAMGTRKKRERQESLWYGNELPKAPGHPFYSRLNAILDKAGFDPFSERSCARFYHVKLGRPSLAPGMYFRIMMIGFFRRHRQRARHCLAASRFSDVAAVSRDRTG